MSTALFYTETYQVRAADTDLLGLASPSALASLLQEVAGDHASSRSLGFEHMQDQGAFWVLNRLRVRVHRYPRWREQLRLETWVRDMRGPFSHRDFEIFDEAGNVLVSAATLWVLLDKQSRRPRRGVIDVDVIPLIPDREALPGGPGKLMPLTEAEPVANYQARYSEIDMVGHVNNVRYLDWVLDGYPPGFWEEKLLREFEINYLSETHLGDQVKVLRQKGGAIDPHVFSLVRGEDEGEICRARLIWEGRS